MFYSIKKLVKRFDLERSDYTFTEQEKELVKLVENYSDEALVRKFARRGKTDNFFQNLDPALFQEHISPYIDKQILKCVSILMTGGVRVFMKQAKYSNLYDEDEVQVNRSFAGYIFQFERTAESTRYNLLIEQDGARINLQNKNVLIVAHNPCCLVFRNKLYAFENLSSKKIMPFLQKEFISIPKQVEEKYYKTFVLNTIKENRVVAKGFTIEEKGADHTVILSLEPTLQYKPAFFVRFRQGEKEYDSNMQSGVFVSMEEKDGSYFFTKIERDFEWEKSIFGILLKLGLTENRGSYTLPITEYLDDRDALYELVNWLNVNREMLEKHGFQLQQNKLGKTYSTDRQELTIEIKTEADWFDVYAKVKIGPYDIPFVQLRKYILNDLREFELPNGEIAVLPKEWFTRYQEILPYAKISGDSFRLKKFHYQLLRKNLKGIDKTYFTRIEEIGQNGQKILLPDKLKATLRSYQEEGFSWLFHLYSNGFGGCLADDMGLGKTLQALALLLKLKRQKQDIVLPKIDNTGAQLDLFASAEKEAVQPASLIVLPVSLVHNWENEIRKFTPSLKIYKYTGNQRRKTDIEKIIPYYDLILTTYGTVRNDIDTLSSLSFFYLILDESQYIKNAASKIYKAISRLSAQQRLVLTGTPIENSLSDLWSQLNFLNPGLLGNQAFFKREFQTPIEKRNDPQQREKLQLLIRPFVLRRTKEEVAKDLPPLTEQIRYCTMARGQREFYEKEKSFIRNTILKNIENEGLEKSAFVVLQGLTRLRQLANHPSMLGEAGEMESGKFNEIFRCLENLMAENHKVLIFSSFVKHLDLLKGRIDAENWKYSVLTGQTRNRGEVISDFQNDPDNRIFLISLKAGGVGLNLTSADYVFIIDPWWNPAAENQAINRAHRIGQDKKVIVYRFITEHSIEEKIQLLKDKKSSLAEKFIHSNDPFKAVTKEEILGLFS
jgi:SNF2 family DNA or RNA helicase